MYTLNYHQSKFLIFHCLRFACLDLDANGGQVGDGHLHRQKLPFGLQEPGHPRIQAGAPALPPSSSPLLLSSARELVVSTRFILWLSRRSRTEEKPIWSSTPSEGSTTALWSSPETPWRYGTGSNTHPHFLVPSYGGVFKTLPNADSNCVCPCPAQVCLRYYEHEFVELACQCPAVVCCRCSPTQKAQIVTLLQQHTGNRTCAIGEQVHRWRQVKVVFNTEAIQYYLKCHMRSLSY